LLGTQQQKLVRGVAEREHQRQPKKSLQAAVEHAPDSAAWLGRGLRWRRPARLPPLPDGRQHGHARYRWYNRQYEYTLIAGRCGIGHACDDQIGK